MDVVATVITWLVVRVSDRPADNEHHYGHGKFESLSALGVIALLYVLAGGILVEFLQPAARRRAAADAVGDPVRGAGDRYRREFLARPGAAPRRARHQEPGARRRCAAFRLRRAGLGRRHHRARASGLGYAWGDAAAAIGVAVMISVLGLRLARSTVETLLDRAPEGVSEKAEAAIRTVPGVVDVERLRVRMVGPTHFIDAIVQVPRTYPIDRVEEIKRTAQDAVSKALGDADLTFTAVPVARDNESVRERIMVIARNSGLAIHHVTVHDLGGRLTVSIDLEVDGEMPLIAAHDIAHELERNIRDEFGEDVEVDTHIEPLEPELPHRHRCRARPRRNHQGRAVAIRRRRRDPRHPQCAGAQHRCRRNRELPLPRRALDERDQGPRERRRDRARVAPRIPDREARHQPRRAAARVMKFERARAFSFRTHFAVSCGHLRILRWTNLFRINELLTLDRSAKLDSNRCDSEAAGVTSEPGAKGFPRGSKGMARAHAANACVQSDSIKGLAQSIAKPAYHRLLIAEPALRRAVPTLIIAFLITICLGAFVQVVDQNRQKRAAIKRDLAALADLLAERLDRIASVRQDRAANIERLQSLLPGLIPSWGIAAGRHVIVTGADQRILARVPIEAALGETAGILDVISAALSLAAPGQQAGVTDITLPNGSTALAIQRVVKSLPGQVIIIQEKVDSIWRSDAALSVTLSATTGFVVLILGFAFHWQSTRAREGDLINDAVRGRIDTALNRGRCGLWDWDLSRGRIFWSQSMFTMLGLDTRSDLLTFGEVNALVKSDDIDLFDDRRPADLRQDRPHRPDLPDAAHRRPLDLAAGPLRTQPGRGRCRPASDRHRRRHHRTEEPRREDGGGRFAAARRDRDHPGSVRAVGRRRPPGALQLALPAPAQAAGFGGDAGHLL